ncbi:raffinose/stachyose/melibiose transport system substrate-binding protein [Mycetocola sp. CAN_C7]|uniref:ABC transporter substrate-binding protein n=1 Tax=Mycetocola sp. CAN_C7 TaxID=2787724 RepID=UPI0018CB3FF1
MKRNTRLASMAIGSAALLLGLAACAPGTGQGDDAPESDGPISTDISGVGETTLTVWDQEVRGGQNEQIEQLNAAFEEKYPNVTIDRVSQAFDDLNTTLRLALTDTDAPDVVQANNGRNTMGAFVEAGQLRALDDYADAYGWTDRYTESILQYSTYSEDAAVFGDGNLYGLPQVGEVVGVFYSKSKLSELGLDVPADWSEFDDALATAKSAGETPMLLGNIEQWPALHVFGPLQAGYVDAEEITNLGLGNSGASWATPENVEAASAMQSWVDSGYFNSGANGTDYDAAWQSLAAGDGVFLIGGSWLAADLADAMGDDLGFFVPAIGDGSLATTGGTGLPFTITSAAENTDVAAAYIDFITSDSAMEIIAETGNLPVNRTAELAPTSGVLADVYSAFGEVTENGSLLPYLDYATPTFGETLGQSLQDLLDGRVTPEEFTEALEADYADFVESNE